MTILGLGQPAAAFPAAPPQRARRAPRRPRDSVVAALAAVLVAVLTVSRRPRARGRWSPAPVAVLVGSQAVLWHRQRRLAGALRRSQTSFRTLVKSSVDPVVILDERLRVTFVSEAITDLLGLDPGVRRWGSPSRPPSTRTTPPRCWAR